MRLGASFVNNSDNYKGDLPPRNGTGDPTAVWPDYGFASPTGPPPLTPTSPSATTSCSASAAGHFSTNTTDQLSSRPSPASSTAGRATRSFPTSRPSTSVRGAGRTWPDGALRLEKTLAQKSYAGGDLTYLSQPGRRACLEIRGSSGPGTSRIATTDTSIPIIRTSPRLGPAPHRLGQNYGRGNVRLLRRVRERSDRALTATSSTSIPTAGRSISRTAGRSTTGSPSTSASGRRANTSPSTRHDPAFRRASSRSTSTSRTSSRPAWDSIYDVTGDSSLKVFGSYGIYYDVMKLYMAAYGAFGGWTSRVRPITRWIPTSGTRSGRTDIIPGRLLLLYN